MHFTCYSSCLSCFLSPFFDMCCIHALITVYYCYFYYYSDYDHYHYYLILLLLLLLLSVIVFSIHCSCISTDPPLFIYVYIRYTLLWAFRYRVVNLFKPFLWRSLLIVGFLGDATTTYSAASPFSVIYFLEITIYY